MADYTILIIDYEPRSIQLLRAPLERAGYRVEVATDGQSGILKFNALKPAAVIIEAMLPKRHGFEVCRDLKQAPHGALCPVMIATSVYRGRKYRYQATHQYLCDAYLEKPIADGDLISAVEAGLRAYQPARQKAKGDDLAIDQTLLTEEVPVNPVPRLPPRSSAQAPTPADAASLDDDEFEIIDRLDALLSDDPSKSSPSKSGD
jgi:DNA-binding response OmpR family regulator